MHVHDHTLENWTSKYTSYTALQFLHMTFAININRCGLNNEVHHEEEISLSIFLQK